MLKHGSLEGYGQSLERRVEQISTRRELEGASPNCEGLIGVNQLLILPGVRVVVSLSGEVELEGASPNCEGLLGVNQLLILLGIHVAECSRSPCRIGSRVQCQSWKSWTWQPCHVLM
jgi:hypothetical protein